VHVDTAYLSIQKLKTSSSGAVQSNLPSGPTM